MTTVGAEWQRLAELLRYTRVVVLGQRSRAAFARSLGLSNDRVLNDLENASRDNYEPDTLLAIERWYGLDSDTLRSILGERYPSHITTVNGVHSVASSRANREDTVEQLRESIEVISQALDDLRAKLSRLEGE